MNGLCEATISVPSQWFAHALPSAGFTVQIRLLSTIDPPREIGSVRVNPRPELNFRNDILVVPPSTPISPLQRFSVPVYGHATYSTAAFSVLCQVGTNLAIEDVAVNADTWLSEVRPLTLTGVAEVGVVAILRDPERALEVEREEAELLFSLEMRVSQSAQGGVSEPINCTTVYLSNMYNEKVRPRDLVMPTVSLVVVGGAVQPGIGHVTIASSLPRGIFSFAEQSQVVNTAVLNGGSVSVGLTHLVALSSGLLETAPSVTCTTNSLAFHLSPQCTHVTLDGSETAGTAGDTILVTHLNSTSSVSLRVWFPTLPVSLRSSPDILRPIEGWLSPNTAGQCSQQYQQATLSVMAEFTYSDAASPVYTVSVLPLLSDLVNSSAPDVVRVSSDDVTLTGVSPGVSVVSCGPSVTPVTVTVTNSSIAISSLDVTLFSGLSLNLPPSPYPPLSTQLASISVDQTFATIATPVFLSPLLVLEGGHTLLLDQQLDGLVISSLAPSVVDTSDGQISLLGAGSGELIQVTLTTSCVGAIAAGNGSAQVTIPSPLRLDVSRSSTLVTYPDDRATIGGIPTSLSLAVTLVFPEGLSRDATNDPLTVYRVLLGVDLVELMTRPSEVVITPSDPNRLASGQVLIMISYQDISVNVSLQVVTYRGVMLFATPFPSYEGSSGVNKSTLFQIESTGVFQQAALELSALLSDGSTVSVTRSPLAFYQAASPTVSISGSIVSVTQPGTYQIQAQLGPDVSTIDLVVTSMPVSISALRGFALSAVSGTFGGLQGTRAALTLDVTFSDATQYPGFIPDASNVFPRVLSLTVDTPSVVSVNPLTGQVTLQNNHHSMVTITASTSGPTQLTGQTSFACNLQPAIGDIDLGFPEGIPVPPLLVGEMVSVPLVVNAGLQLLGRAQLTVSYSTQTLGVVSVSPNSSWLGSLQHTDNGGLLFVTALSSSGLTGLVSLGTIEVMAIGPGVGSVGGIVMRLDDTAGRPIGSGRLRDFVAGAVTVDIPSSSRARREAAAVLGAPRRVRRNTQCSPPFPCVMCPQGGRETGDINGDCIFDSTDVLHLLQYHVEDLFDFQLDSGSSLLSSLMAAQERQLDSDLNSALDIQDAYFLHGVQLGLINFLGAISVEPVQESAACQLAINATLLGGRDITPDQSQTAIFFDISLPFDPTFTSQRLLDDSELLVGSVVPTVDKGLALPGAVFQASPLDDGVYAIVLETNLTMQDIGVSVIQTTSALPGVGGTNQARTKAMFGSPDPPYAHPNPLAISLPVFSDTVVVRASQGYTSFASFNNTMSSLACITPPPPPIVPQPLVRAAVAEDISPGGFVATVTAQSQSERPVVYSIATGNVGGAFAVGSSSGVVSVAVSLDREVTGFYTLQVLATDPASGFSTGAVVEITVTDINDNAPMFQFTAFELPLPANTPVGAFITMLLALDSDVAANADVAYTTPGDVFAVDANTGIVTLRQALDFDSQDTHLVTVVATDMGIPPLSSSVTLNITVLPPDPTVLQFENTVYNSSIAENSRDGVELLQLQASAVNASEAVMISYALRSPMDAPFTVNASNGLLVVSGTIDREVTPSYTLSVTARVVDSSRAIPALAVVFVTVVDVNDNPPVFERDEYTATTPEEMPAGSLGLFVTAQDPDVGLNGAVRYSLVEASSDLSIEAASGLLSNTQPLDRELADIITVIVVATDSGEPALSSLTNVTIMVGDINDNAPSLQVDPAMVSVNESVMVGSVVGVAVVSDADSQDVNGVISLDVLHADTLIPAAEFAVSAETGEITTSQEFDYELVQLYDLLVRARDNGSPPLATTQNFTVLISDVNDNQPLFEADVYNVTLSENTSISSIILELVAFDADSGSNAEMLFSIESVTPTENLFQVDSNGTLQLASPLDYETTQMYDITVRVENTAPGVGTDFVGADFATVYVEVTNVNEFPPVFFPDVYLASVSEEMLEERVTRVMVNDSDLGDVVVLSVDSTAFRIGSEGVIVTAVELDREMTARYNITVLAMDEGDPARTATALVMVDVLDINDNEPVFAPFADLSILDSTPVGTPLLALSASDADDGVNGDIDVFLLLTPTADFSLTDGELTVARPLDSSEVSRHLLTVLVSDSGDPPLNTSAVITIVVAPSPLPVFQQSTYSASVVENNSPNTFLVEVRATPQNPDAVVTEYRLLLPSPLFAVDPVSGNVTALVPLDREESPFHSITVEAEAELNSTNLAATAVVNITVLDANDNSPQFLSPFQSISINETIDPGVVVAEFEAFDADIGSNAVIEYSISSGNDELELRVDGNGTVLTAAPILGTLGLFNVSILAANPPGVGQRSNTTQLVVEVLPVNAFDPVFDVDQITITLSEDTLTGAIIAAPLATDSDLGSAGDLIYSLTPESTTFAIDPISGNITLVQDLDFETVSNYTLTLTATDEGLPPRSADSALLIVVTDSNDNPPVFSQPLYIGSLEENLPPGQSILTVVTSDEDTALNALVTYDVLPSDFSAMFQVTSTGVLQNSLSLDREQLSSATLTITAMNRGSGVTQSATAMAVVTIVDVNDKTPMFSQPQYSRVLQAPVLSNSTLLTVMATDEDSTDSNNRITFAISDNSSTFDIDPATGVVQSAIGIDDAGNFTFTVTATDNGVVMMSGRAVVSVVVLPTDDLTAGRERDFVFNTEQGISLVGSPSELSASSFQQLFGLAVGRDNRQPRVISASLGSLSDMLGVIPSMLQPVSVTAVLVAREVWPDDPVVRVVVQVRDATHNVHIRTSVTAQLRHVSLGMVPSTCTTRTTDGTCTVNIPLNDTWFQQRANATVEFGLNPLTTLGSVELQEQPVLDVRSDIYTYVQMPLRSLFVGDTVSIPVFGRTGSKGVGSYTLTVFGSTHLAVLGLTEDATRWSAQTRTRADGGITITAVLSDQSTSPPAQQVLLFTIRALVLDSGTLDTLIPAPVTVQVVGLSDFDRSTLIPPPSESGPVRSFFLSRSGTDRSGVIYVSSDNVVGILPYLDNAEVVNTALLNGEPVLEPILKTNVHRSGRVVDGSGIFASSCSSVAPRVVNVSADCSSIMLTTDQTMAFLNATVTITQGGLSGSFPVLVWTPQSPLGLTVSDQSLEVHAGMLDPQTNCTALRQTSNIRAFASFTNTAQSLNNIDVTAMVTAMLTSSNTDAALVTGAVIQPRRAGIATIQTSPLFPGLAFPDINVTVVDTPVEVLGLDVRVLTGIRATGPGVVSRIEVMNPLQVTTEQELNFEGTQGTAIATAVFSDGTRMLLDETQVTFTSLAPDIVSVSGALVTALASGSGELVEAVWTSPCNDIPIAMGRASVAVTIPMPRSVDVTISTPRLSAPGSTASSIGIRTSATLTVTAQYSDGRMQDLTTDSRTLYTAPSNIDLSVSGGVVTIATNDNATMNGVFTISVAFSQFQGVMRTVSYSIVSVTDIVLRATPFPAYPDSTLRNVARLSPVATSSPVVRQQAAISATAILSGAETPLDVSTNAELNFTVQGSSATLENSAIIARATFNVLNFADASPSGTLTISARLREITANSSLELDISPVPVQISSISISPFPDGTLKGVVNITQRQVVISVTFDDSTQYVNLFQPLFIPGLVTFQASPPSAVTVGVASGIATLRGNAPSLANITVQSLGNSISETLMFACNLDPGFGDVDLGSLTNLPLSPITFRQQVAVPVRVNSSSAILDSIELDVTFDPAVFRAVSAEEGADWPASGRFQFTANDPINIITVGGTLVGSTSVIGASLHLATILFEVVGTSSGLTSLSGMVHTFAESSRSGTASNIGTVPRPFVAGSIQTTVTGSTRQRRDTSSTAVPSPRVRRQSSCVSPPCVTCSPRRETGDVDGNCVFDVRDVSFLQLHYLTTITNGTEPALPPDRRQFLDADINGEVNANDVVFMLRVNFRLLRFSSLPEFVPVETSGDDCEFAVSVALVTNGDAPADNDTTAVIFDIALESPSSQAMFDASNFTTGSVLPASKGPNVYGGLVLAEYLGEGVYGIRAESALDATMFGVSPIQVTFDAIGGTSASRTAAMFSNGTPRYSMLDAMFALRGEMVTISTQVGYSPLLLVNSTISTAECLRLQSPLTFLNTPYMTAVSEAADVGASVLQVSATSTRPSPSIMYSLVGDAMLPFALNSNTGVLELSATLDFESTPSYTFHVMGSEVTMDNETLTARASVTITVINVNDLPPEIDPLPDTLVLASREVGEQVLQVVARDPDGLDSLVYNVSGGTVPNLFSISGSGSVTIAASLLRSANTAVTINITVMDTALSANAQVTLDIFLPSFSQDVYSGSVSEATTPGSVIVSLSLLNTGTENFTLVTLDPTFTAEANGMLLTNAALDYEVEQTYRFTVLANSSNIEITTNVTINVLDVNDNAPEFTEASYNISISSSSGVGASFLQLSATDMDSLGPNSDITYSISQDEDSLAYFGISADTGDVTLLLSLFDGPSVVIVNITATDNGSPSLSSTVTLTVTVESSGLPEFPLLPRVRTLGGVLALSGPTRSSQIAFRQDVSKLVGLLSGQISASFAGSNVEASTILSSPVGVATSARSILLYPSDEVHQEDSLVRIAVQVRDDNLVTRVSATSVGVRAVLTTTNDMVTSEPCTPDPNSGICLVTLSLPDRWFSMGNTSALFPTLNDEDAGTPPEVLSLQPAPTSAALTSGILVECPARDIVSGGSLLLEVYSYSSFPISGFSMLFQTSAQLTITALLIDTTQWSVETVNTTRQFGLSAVSSSPEVVMSGARVLLYSLRVSTSSGLTFPIIANITAQVQSLSNTVEGSVVLATSGATSGPAQFLSRSGQGTSGAIHIAPNSILALFPYTQQPELMNTAALSGTDISIPVQLLAGYASGDVLPHNGVGVACSSSHPDVLTTNHTSTCTTLVLSGTETAGSDWVVVTYSIGSASGELPLRVYYPQAPFLYTMDRTLNRIQYAEGCSRYQRTTLSVFADFAASSQLMFPNVQITDLIAPTLFSGNSSVVSLDGSTLQGVSPGSVIICSRTASSCTDVIVSDKVVEISAVVGSVLIDISVTTSDRAVSVNSTGVVTISPRSQFQFEQEQGTLLVAVQFTDGAISAVSSDEITILPSNSSVYEVRDNAIVSVGSGEAVGSFLWQPLEAQCNLDIVDFFRVTSSLPSPVSIRTSLLPPPRLHALTTPTNPASLVGVPTSLPLAITLVFEGGRTLDATNDPRVTVTPSSDNIEVSGGLVTATGFSTNETELTIQYQDGRVTLTSTVELVVVMSQGVAVIAHPFPSFPDSDTITTGTLSPIENTGVWERARLELTLSLSNGTTVYVTGSPNAMLETMRVNGTGNVIVQLSSASILTVVDGTGIVLVTGHFSTDFHQLDISVVTTPVTVTGAEIVGLPQDTLRGVAGRSSQQLSVDLALSDGTRLLSYPTNPAFADQMLPGIATYSANNVAFTVSSSGELQPLFNTHNPVSVGVIAGSNNVANSYSFVVNLDPDVGDVDIGSASGTPIMPGHVGQEGTFPVLVNTGGMPLGSVDVLLTYDVSVMRPLEVTAGPGFGGGLHQASLNDPPGEIRFGGALSEDVSGVRLHLFNVRVRYIGVPGESSLQGSLLTLAERTFAGAAIGPPTPRPITAGNVTFEVTGSRKRSAPQPLPSPSNPRQRRQALCPMPPCTCSGMDLGDTDGNCVFDVRDVSYTLLYISQNLLGNSPGSEGVMVTQAQLRQLDPNQDDTIDTSDAFFLLRALFRLVYFLTSAEVIPVQEPSSQCLFTVQLQLESAGDVSIGPVEVLVDFAFQTDSEAGDFARSELVAGEVLTTEKGEALNGALVLAQPTAMNGIFTVQLNSSFVSSDVGVSLIIVTFDAENATSGSRSVQFLGGPPLRYPPLFLNETVVRSTHVVIAALSGYSPFLTAANTLPSSMCSDIPILEPNLNVNFSSPFQAELTWILLNMRMELDLTSDLTLVVTSCTVSQRRVTLNETCDGSTRVTVDTATSHTLPTTPFTAYFLQVLAPTSSTDPVGVVSPESTPSGVQFPKFTVIENKLEFEWSLPASPNGVITHYTLYLYSETAYNGSDLTYSLSLPVPLPLNYSLEAHNSAGTGSSGVGSVSSLRATDDSPGLSVAAEEAIIITVVLAAILIAVLLIIMCCGMAKRRRDHLAKKTPAFLSSNFEAENIGVVSVCVLGMKVISGV